MFVCACIPLVDSLMPMSLEALEIISAVKTVVARLDVEQRGAYGNGKQWLPRKLIIEY